MSNLKNKLVNLIIERLRNQEPLSSKQIMEIEKVLDQELRF